MPWHEVEQGEWIQKIAVDNRFYKWETIWNHPQNASLKQQRKEPNLLMPGDRVFIPDLQPKELSAATDQKHVYLRKSPKMSLYVIFQDSDGNPLKGKPWKLKIDDKEYSGTTDNEGALHQEVPVTSSTSTGTAKCEGYEYEVRLGHLDPLTEISGVKKRLANMGFFSGPLDQGVTDDFTDAIKDFQRTWDLPVTGEVDDATRNKLKEKHKS